MLICLLYTAKTEFLKVFMILWKLPASTESQLSKMAKFISNGRESAEVIPSTKILFPFTKKENEL